MRGRVGRDGVDLNINGWVVGAVDEVLTHPRREEPVSFVGAPQYDVVAPPCRQEFVVAVEVIFGFGGIEVLTPPCRKEFVTGVGAPYPEVCMPERCEEFVAAASNTVSERLLGVSFCFSTASSTVSELSLGVSFCFSTASITVSGASF